MPSPNPGGKSKRREQHRIEMLNVLSAHGAEAAQLLMQYARKGNVTALRTWLAYVLGEPKQAVELMHVPSTGPEFDPTRLTNEQLIAATQGLAAAMVLHRARDAGEVSGGDGEAVSVGVVPES